MNGRKPSMLHRLFGMARRSSSVFRGRPQANGMTAPPAAAVSPASAPADVPSEPSISGPQHTPSSRPSLGASVTFSEGLTTVSAAIAGDIAHVNRGLRLAGYDVKIYSGKADPVRCSRRRYRTYWQWAPPPPPTSRPYAAAMSGRQLTIREVERFIERQNAAVERSVADCLAWLTVTGRIQQIPGLQRGPFGTLRCVGCGETDLLRAWDCAVCGEHRCWMCEACRSLGQVRACTVMYAAEAQTEARSLQQITIHAPELTKAQQRASRRAGAVCRFRGGNQFCVPPGRGKPTGRTGVGGVWCGQDLKCRLRR